MDEGKHLLAGDVGAVKSSPKVARLLKDAQSVYRAGRFQESKLLFEQVLKLEPNQAIAWKGLGAIALAAGALRAAVNILVKSLELDPTDVEARQHYAHALQGAGEIESALLQWHLICQQVPDNADYLESLGVLLQAVGDRAEAAEAYSQAQALKPSLALRAKMATLLSPVVASREAIQQERSEMGAQLQALCDEDLEGSLIADPMGAALWTNFYLAYHGLPNRALQAQTAQMYARLVPSLNYVAPVRETKAHPTGKIRIGLISQFFHNHSIGRTSRGLFEQLSKERFDVTAIFIAPTVDDEYAKFIRQHADRSVVVPQDLKIARAAIVAERLDILFYQDIGMEPFSYFLAFSRLAPVQCVSFGHPDTTGLPAIDCFISSTLFELPEAAAHYTERLYLLQDVGAPAYYYRPRLPEILKNRADFGLSDTDRIYLCPQNLFKIHPDMDDLLGAILRKDVGGKLVLISGKIQRWTEHLRRRWTTSLPDVMDRIVFLPRQSSPDYLNLIALADVMLDTVHFNGMNTSLEAFAVGTPVVTWPTELQRGRHTQAMYRQMGLGDWVASTAAAYVDMAVSLANSPEQRSQLQREIQARSGCLFEDRQVIQELERCFVALVR